MASMDSLSRIIYTQTLSVTSYMSELSLSPRAVFPHCVNCGWVYCSASLDWSCDLDRHWITVLLGSEGLNG